MKTRSDLIYRALRNLGVLPMGQTPSDEEFASVNDLVDPVVEELVSRDIYHLADVDAIPDDAFQSLGHILASACRAEFGLAGDAAIVALGIKAERDLQMIQHSRPTYQVLPIIAY